MVAGEWLICSNSSTAAAHPERSAVPAATFAASPSHLSEHLHIALTSWIAIEHAKGVLAERGELTMDRASDVLRRAKPAITISGSPMWRMLW